VSLKKDLIFDNAMLSSASTLQKLCWHISNLEVVQESLDLITYWCLRGPITDSIGYLESILFPLFLIEVVRYFLIFYLYCSRGNLSHETFLRNARNSEETLRKEAVERTDLSHLKGTPRLASFDTLPGAMYQVESTGAVVSLNSAVGLIHFYCSQLPSDRCMSFYHFVGGFRFPPRLANFQVTFWVLSTFVFSFLRYSILRPEFIMERHENPGGSTEYSCKMQLPGNAPFEKLEGPVCCSMRLAQQVWWSILYLP